jgi:hypothetical protein
MAIVQNLENGKSTVPAANSQPQALLVFLLASRFISKTFLYLAGRTASPAARSVPVPAASRITPA